MLRNQNGVTLVALVVTIVILIILATISISVAIDSGLIGAAQDSNNHMANAEAEFNEFQDTILNLIYDEAGANYFSAPETVPDAE